MKKYTLTFSVFLFLIHSCLIAQTIELNEQNGQHSEVKKIHGLKNNRWFISAGLNGLDNSLINFSVIDTNEFIKSNILLDGYGVKDIILKDDAGFAWLLNEFNGGDGLIRIEVDSNSVTIGAQTDFVSASASEILHGVEILPNGKLIIFGTKIISTEQRAFFKILSNNYVVQSENYLTKGFYDDILIYPNSSFMLVGRLGNNLVYGGKNYNENYQAQGDIIEIAEADDIYKIGEEYFILKNEMLSKLDSNFQIENSILLEDYGVRIDLEVDDENIFLLFQEEENAPMILKINNELEVVNFFAVGDKYFRANDIHLSENEIGVGGFLIPDIPFNNTPFLYPSTSTYFKTFSKSGIAEYENVDLEIIDVKVEDYEKKFTCGSQNIADVYLLNLKKINVNFVNKGTTTINEISLFTEIKGLENCVSSSFGPEYYLQKEEIKSLGLEPGDTLFWRIPSFEFPHKMEDSAAVELCIWHTSVENKRDRNTADNYFCGVVELTKRYEEFPIITPEEEVLIFPNPLDDVMTVSLLQAPFETTSIEFYDFLGRKLEQKYLISSRAKYKEFDISEIPSGFYFLHISNDLINEGIQVYVK